MRAGRTLPADQSAVILHEADTLRVLGVIRSCSKSVYVAPFSFAVVPRGRDRNAAQMSAARCREEQKWAIDAFINVGRQMEIMK